MNQEIDQEIDILQEILKIKNHFGFTTKKMSELTGLKLSVFKANCCLTAKTNNFKLIHLVRLEQEIKKNIMIYETKFSKQK